MRIDFRASGHWQAINDSVTERLREAGQSGGSEVHVYQGIGHALVEAVVGASQLYPLKKKVHFFKKMNPYFDAALLPLAKLGYQMIPLELEILKNPGEWASALSREDLLVLYSVDDPLLGRTFETRAFEETLREKSLVQIRVSHARHSSEGPAQFTPRYGIYLYSLADSQLAIACLGERARIGAQVADQLFYNDVTDEQLKEFINPTPIDAAEIKAWQTEMAKAASAKILWPDLDQHFDNRIYGRLCDRALIYWEDMDGHALIDRLATRLKLTLRAPEFENRLETTSLSRWGGVRTMDFYKGWDIGLSTLRDGPGRVPQ